ncbi:MAG: hypothetical protein Q4G50_07325 [Corynebacterium sp.]|uniref:hypothetical protein n=1 Tax=Corynebacterium sp. TaxID=1720 RepID=UPI0026DF4324|nr:hypothetical protein [Corynebacterium sp.]MDO5669798.1 hypothetical protein [Corynebacterium sp.]
MAPSRRTVSAGVLVALCLSTSACSDRLEPAPPVRHKDVDQMQQWSSSRAEPYGIPERQLRAYAFAAWSSAQESGCQVGWPTLAALGALLSDHGRVNGAEVGEDGATTVALRGLNLMRPEHPQEVPDTDAGIIDGDSHRDIPVGPLQIMPSRWEQFGVSAEPHRPADPDNIDDAALTTAHILCTAGDPTSPEGWDAGLKEIDPDPEFIKAVHARAQEYSR